MNIKWTPKFMDLQKNCPPCWIYGVAKLRAATLYNSSITLHLQPSRSRGRSTVFKGATSGNSCFCFSTVALSGLLKVRIQLLFWLTNRPSISTIWIPTYKYMCWRCYCIKQWQNVTNMTHVLMVCIKLLFLLTWRTPISTMISTDPGLHLRAKPHFLDPLPPKMVWRCLCCTAQKWDTYRMRATQWPLISIRPLPNPVYIGTNPLPHPCIVHSIKSLVHMSNVQQRVLNWTLVCF